MNCNEEHMASYLSTSTLYDYNPCQEVDETSYLQLLEGDVVGPLEPPFRSFSVDCALDTVILWETAACADGEDVVKVMGNRSTSCILLHHDHSVMYSFGRFKCPPVPPTQAPTKAPTFASSQKPRPLIHFNATQTDCDAGKMVGRTVDGEVVSEIVFPEGSIGNTTSCVVRSFVNHGGSEGSERLGVQSSDCLRSGEIGELILAANGTFHGSVAVEVHFSLPPTLPPDSQAMLFRVCPTEASESMITSSLYTRSPNAFSKQSVNLGMTVLRAAILGNMATMMATEVSGVRALRGCDNMLHIWNAIVQEVPNPLGGASGRSEYDMVDEMENLHLQTDVLYKMLVRLEYFPDMGLRPVVYLGRSNRAYIDAVHVLSLDMFYGLGLQSGTTHPESRLFLGCVTGDVSSVQATIHQVTFHDNNFDAPTLYEYWEVS